MCKLTLILCSYFLTSIIIHFTMKEILTNTLPTNTLLPIRTCRLCRLVLSHTVPNTAEVQNILYYGVLSTLCTGTNTIFSETDNPSANTNPFYTVNVFLTIPGTGTCTVGTFRIPRSTLIVLFTFTLYDRTPMYR